ncbi:MAG: hypothetical protein ACK44D_03115 [Bacteroidia bacterium]|jgi:hypothetical protein
MVKRIGFICEGESEKIIIESERFQLFLTQNGLSCAKVVDANGNGSLLPKNIKNHLITMERYDAEVVVILTDLDEDKCITLTKDRIKPGLPENAIVVVSVKAIESWFLADSSTMSTITKKNFFYELPEKTDSKPIDAINEVFKMELDRGVGRRGKPGLAKYFVNQGFEVNNAAQHPNCPSAKYFINKLQELAQ